MQISKSFLVVCAVACCTALPPLCAADADTQSKLQEALNQKLNELQTQPPAPAPQPPVTTPKPAKQPAPAAVSMPAPAAQPVPVATPSAADSEATERAREALRQKMMELQVPSGGRPTPPAQWKPAPVARPSAPAAQPVAPAPAVQPVPPIVPKTPSPASVVQSTPKPVLVAPPPVDSEAIAKAREALRQKMSELEIQPAPASVAKPAPAAAQPVFTAPPAVQPPPAVAQPAPAPLPAAPPVVKPPAPAPAVQAASEPTLVLPPAADPESIAKARTALEQKMKELATQAPAPTVAPAPGAPGQFPRKPKVAKGQQPFPPIPGPGTAVSADKQQRLAELLRKYKADEISPEEYHQQRAKVMSEP